MEKKMELCFNNVSLKCEGYNVEDIITILELVTERKAAIPTVKNSKRVNVEEINIKELGKTMRMPKTTNNFRCPHCGQALIALYQPISGENELLVRNITLVSPEIYKARVVELPRIDDSDMLINIYKDLLTLLGEKIVLVENNEELCRCPHCLEDNTISDWIEAYNNPLKFFEFSNICDICGEEGNTVITALGEFIECKKDCLKNFKK